MTDTQQRPLVDPDIAVDDFAAQATAWFEANSTRRPHSNDGLVWGEGNFDVSVFSDMSFEDEQAHILSIAEWIQKKATKGYHAADWPAEFGGLGLSRAHARSLGRIERQFQSPGSHELVSVTVGLVASTIRVLGSEALKERFAAAPTRSPANSSANQELAPTSQASPPAPFVMATSGWSTGRRCGVRGLSSASGVC